MIGIGIIHEYKGFGISHDSEIENDNCASLFIEERFYLTISTVIITIGMKYCYGNKNIWIHGFTVKITISTGQNIIYIVII